MESSIKTILIIYHSQSGNTKRMAEAVLEGIQSVGGHGILKWAGNADLSDLLASDALIIGTPEYFGYMAGIIKDFFDRIYEKAIKEPSLFRKPYCLFISAGNDGTGAKNSVERICIGLKLRKIQEVIISKGRPSEDILNSLKEMGMTVALGLQEGIF